MEIPFGPFLVVFVLMSLLSSWGRLQQQPPESKLPSPQPDDLLCPPPAQFYPPSETISLSPSPVEVSPPPKSLCLYYPPPPPPFLPPEFSFSLEPPPAPESSSHALSSSILRWLLGLGGTVVATLLLLGCKMLMTQRAAPPQPAQDRDRDEGITKAAFDIVSQTTVGMLQAD